MIFAGLYLPGGDLPIYAYRVRLYSDFVVRAWRRWSSSTNEQKCTHAHARRVRCEPRRSELPTRQWPRLILPSSVNSDLAGLAFVRSPGSRRPLRWLVEPPC
eukprot:101330-Prymnesium_polylepis.1